MKHPLTLAVIVLALVLVTYCTVNYDRQIFSAVRGLQDPALDAAMLFITSIATLYIGVPIIILALYFSKHRKVLWDLAPALAIGIILTFLIKAAIARPRPEEIFSLNSIVSAFFSSFPSDHTSTAFIMFGVIGHHIKKYKLWFYALAVLIGLSRVYLGAHYPTDVLAGALLGILVSQAVMRYKIGGRLKKAVMKK